MDQDAIIQYVADTFPGVDVLQPMDGPGAGDTFFYDPRPEPDPKHRLPFATIVTKDYGDFDNASHLDRPGVFRLNIGVNRDTFRRLFGPPPEAGDREGAGGEHDFAALDRLMPHPVYGAQSWVCVLNPSAETFEAIKPLLSEAYGLAAGRPGGRTDASP